MHELSVAYNLVEIAEQAAQENGVNHVTAVHLQVGVLSGVVKSALLFGYDVATAGTMLEGSRLEIEEMPVVIHCPSCQADRPLPDIQSFRCPVCDTPTHQIVQGQELRLVALETEE